MANRVKNKIILVTGSTSGIGESIAYALANEGATVIVSGRNKNAGNQVVKTILNNKGTAEFIPADVTDPKQLDNLFSCIISAHKRLDCAVNNAAYGGGKLVLFHESTEDYWDSVMAVNLKGVWRCMKHEVDIMLKQKYGSIINISSVAGLIGGSFGYTAYCASKHAILGLTKSTALEYAKKNIRVNAICPGFTLTPMFKKYFGKNEQDYKELINKHVPVGRIGQPEEVAHAAVYLCSDESSYTTGTSIVMDGGLST